MITPFSSRDVVIVVSPAGPSGTSIAAAACRAGGLGALDLGTGDVRVREELDLLERQMPGGFAVRVPNGCLLDPADLPRRADTVLLGRDSHWQVAGISGDRRVLVEVTSIAEAAEAARAGAHGVIARGQDGRGPTTGLSSFVLLQQLVDTDLLPVWLAGDIGPRTAAAAIVGGAAGVVLDTHGDTAGPGDDRSAGAAVRPVLDAVLAALDEDQVRAVAAALRPNSALCSSIGCELPIAQGPMTRVSDQAEFAASVARHGALPFVALALAGAAQTRALLEQTRAAIPDRPWGVGVLGFAPEDVRAAQLEVIRELRPSCAIVAGGRPSQAAALEADGIATFLHVPSPGLLRQFLDAGARRFVFEGSECGGHVGPATSLPLWEAQIGVLEAFLAAHPEVASEIQVFFAGGIHDSRSGAMVGVAAGALAARGVEIGMLMGTAYLFTEEAVTHGAVVPAFQEQVVTAETTVLLETAPGHATRCVASPFTQRFEALKAELRAGGLPDREVWQQLEEVNVGRLRIASKGMRRDGAELVSVPESDVLDEGLFMAGQVAVLRSEVTTIDELHRSVTDGAAAFVAGRTDELRENLDVVAATVPEAPPPLDIAVVGMACAFPGAPDLATFWSNVVHGVDAVTEVPVDRWDPEIYFGQGPDRTPSRWGGFLPEIPFDPLRYGIPPSSLSAIEPVQLLALLVADRALADAGLGGADDGGNGFDRERTSVVFGAEAGSDLANATVLRSVLPSYLGTVPEQLADQLPVVTEDTFPGSLANVIAGRIANRLDLGGANFTVDAACASSLAAVDAACKELVAGTSDVVLAGGADLHNGINDYLMFASVQALSPTGRCATFDRSVDGIALGEGVGCVVLKRLADAERDGDRVYAVIKGIGSASDGRSLGLTAPRPEGQRRALVRAYCNARISPADVGLVEAHGTGTVVGDRTELATLTDLFGAAGAVPGRCSIGSVKSQIGHTKCAAGLAGLIKTAMALHTSTLPPTLHVGEPNPAWAPDDSPFSFSGRARPWAAPPEERIAGVSAFGFGGTNFHVVLAAHDAQPTPRHGLDEWPAEVFTFRDARDVQWMLDLAAPSSGPGAWRLRDLARTAGLRARRRSGPVTVAVVAADPTELVDQLRRALAGEHEPARGLFQPETRTPGKLAVLFPGQGSQRTGMLAELFVAFPEAQHFLRIGRQWADAVFPPTAFTPQAEDDQQLRLRDTRAAQPALGIAGLAVHHLLTRLGVRADMFAGHSYGELVALCAAGAFDAETLLALSAARAEAILSSVGADPGTMAAVAAPAAEVRAILRDAGDEVVVANVNGPRQTVISGATEPVEQALAALRQAGLAGKKIPVACAFHSPLVADAGAAFALTLAERQIRAPEIPVWSNRTATAYPTGADEVRAELADQIGSPVDFVAEIEAMYADGARVFVEAGPGRVLGRLVDGILGDRPHTTVACDGRGLSGFLAAVAQLAVSGVELDTNWLFEGRDARDISDAQPPRRPGWTIDGQTVRTADGGYLAGGLVPARIVEDIVMAPSRPGEREQLISEFLRTSRDAVAAQRDVLLSYLGTPAAAPVVIQQPAPIAAGQVAAQPVARPTFQPAESPVAVSEPAVIDVLETVRSVIGERTGYPVDMIEPELDLEADLSVDSIKRTEIAGELLSRIRVPDADVDDLVKLRTAATIVTWLNARMGQGAPADPATAAEPPPEWTSAAPGRFTVERVRADVEPVAADALAGRTFAVVGGSADAVAALTSELATHGASVTTDGACDGLIHLGVPGQTVPDLVPLFQKVLSDGPPWLFAVGAQPGLRGLFRSLQREYPGTSVRLVELEPGAPAAELVVAELLAGDANPVVITGHGVRDALELTRTSLGSLASSGAGPAGDGAAEAEALGLGPESVVLLVGGARGITARFAETLAAASGCRIELIGRTPVPDGREDPATADAVDLAGLRSALAAAGYGSPPEIDRRANQILAQREVAATLDALRGRVRYHAADVRDADAVRQIVKDIHAEHGRLDGLVCAAGIIEDKLFAEKDQESFRRVFETKVDGTRTLLSALADGAVPGFVVLFGSIAAALGNRGQTDYAAANDALESIGADWAQRTGQRALTVHWGPWAPDPRHGGMVDPALGRSYAKRGIDLIDPEEGALSLLRELAWGDPAVRSVVYTASGW